MCQAHGKLWNDYARNQRTQEFLAELSAVIGIPITELVQSRQGGNPQLQRVPAPTSGKEINRPGSGEKGLELKFLIYKNSLAPHEKIEVEMLWYTDYEDRDRAGHFRQKTYFDWQAASVETLIKLIRAGGKKAKRIWEILDVHPMDDRRVWSQKLGITAKRPVSYRQFGELLEAKLTADGAFRNALYAECGIRRRCLFQPGQDFRKQEEAAVVLVRRLDAASWKAAAQAQVMDLAEAPTPDVILEEVAQDPPVPDAIVEEYLKEEEEDM